jgi:hypothetical protein
VRARLLLDDAVGERRRMLVNEDGAPFRLDLERWSEMDGRARTDEVWLARVGARLAGGGWHVGLGSGPDGVLDTTAGSLHEGQLVSVKIKAEARGGKGPVVSLHALAGGIASGAGPGRHAQALADPFLAGVEAIEQLDGEEARSEIDPVVEAVAEQAAAIGGGGHLVIESTAALTVIDVDTGDRTGVANGASRRDFNLAAALEAARQVSLRGIAGLVVVDFLTMSAAADRRTIAAAFRDQLRTYVARRSDVLEISPLGLCEASVSRRMRGAAETLRETPADQRAALDLLRRLESEARSQRGRRLRARVDPAAHAWLEADVIGWKAALAGRIGQRWDIQPGDAGARTEVWSE